MSSVIPGCDSDEEVFWGPVTAKELEIIWRSRMANKNLGESANPVEKFVKNPEGLNKSSDNINTSNSNNSVQEVPTLQDLRNFRDRPKILFEGNDHEHNIEDSEHEPVENEPSLPLLETSVEINQDQKETQIVNDLLTVNSNHDKPDQVILREHEEYPKNPIEIYEKSTEIPENSMEIPEKSMEIPEESIESPEKSKKSPEKSMGIPEKSMGSPEESIESPEKSKKSPDKSMGSPEKSMESPEKSMESLENSIDIPKNSMEISEKLIIPDVGLTLTITEEKIDFAVNSLKETLQEPTGLNQPDEAVMSIADESNQCCDSSGEGISETSNVLFTNCDQSSSEDCSNNDTNIQVAYSECHTSFKGQQVNSVNVAENEQDKSFISNSENIESINLNETEDQSESLDSRIDMSLNQSNIENIPPEQPESARHKELKGSDVAENVDSFIKTNTSRLNGDNVLQEILIDNQDDSLNSKQVSKVNDIGADTNGASESSDEKSFVSLSEDDNCISSSNSHYSSANQDCAESLTVQNKENEKPACVQIIQDCVKSKIPVSNHIKPTFLKPARLQNAAGVANEKWLNDLKRKKIPKPKKPDYMVSPAKLGSILKSRNQPTPADKPPVVDVKKSAQSKIAISTPKPIPGSSKSMVTPKKKQYEFIKSPISEYIRTGTGIPTAKSLPALKSPHKIPVPLSVKQTPVQKLPAKFYSSAEKLVIKPGTSSVLKPAENRLFLTPKIFKHQGRVADLKKPGDINVVTPRAVRKTSLTETSFACLPQSSKQLDVSVLEEL